MNSKKRKQQHAPWRFSNLGYTPYYANDSFKKKNLKILYFILINYDLIRQVPSLLWAFLSSSTIQI